MKLESPPLARRNQHVLTGRLDAHVHCGPILACHVRRNLFANHHDRMFLPNRAPRPSRIHASIPASDRHNHRHADSIPIATTSGAV
jgi:hypothetical protein